MFLGIDLGGTTCTFGVLDEQGAVQGRLEIETRQSDAPDVMLPRIAAAARETIAAVGADVATVGIGVPGPVKHTEGVCVLAPNLHGWKMLPVGPLLAQQIGLPVHVLNDANA